MTTYAILQARIADELARSDLTTNIQYAIKSAAAYYARERFFFNEAVTTFATVASQSWYTSSDLAAIATLSEIDVMRIALGTTSYTLTPTTIGWIEEQENSTAITSDPTHYAYYRRQIRLWPTPNQVRTITMDYVAVPAELSADGDSNCWTTDAEALTRYRAKWDLFSNVIRDPAEAGIYKQLEIAEVSSLRAASARVAGSGTLVPTQF